jgi:hypothetical protein
MRLSFEDEVSAKGITWRSPRTGSGSRQLAQPSIPLKEISAGDALLELVVGCFPKEVQKNQLTPLPVWFWRSSVLHAASICEPE